MPQDSQPSDGDHLDLILNAPEKFNIQVASFAGNHPDGFKYDLEKDSLICVSSKKRNYLEYFSMKGIYLQRKSDVIQLIKDRKFQERIHDRYRVDLNAVWHLK